MSEQSGRWPRRGIAVVAMLFGAAVTAACNLVAGVDELEAGGPCDEQGKVRCNDDNTPETCGKDGSWEPQQECKGSTCDKATGKCAGACAPLERECAGNTPQVCGANGQWEDGPEGACVSQTCNTGECVGICAPGQGHCSADNKRQTCGKDGQWEDVPDGACVKQTCRAGTCVGECAPGKRCGGDTPQICNADGLWKDSGPACDGQNHCEGGTCVEVCVTGDLRCTGDVPLKCDGDGAWKNHGPVCPVCFGCNPDTAACDPAQEPVCTDPTVIAAGTAQTCALLPGGSVKCWGNSGYGQLGLGDTQSRGDGPNEMGATLPKVALGSDEKATALAGGRFHTCALLAGGSVKCWGYNLYGQLGLGDMLDRGDGPNEMGGLLPKVDLGTSETATAITTGAEHTCVVLSGGSVKCWGRNYYGDLGLGDELDRGDGSGEMGDMLPKVDLGPGETATAITAGRGHTCALLAGGSVKCWGLNYYGELGLGDKQWRGGGPFEMGALLLKVDLGPDETATAITAGYQHTCALLAGGSVKCWGHNDYGQLGLGDTLDRGDGPFEMGDLLPKVDLGSGETATAITAGYNHTCALLAGGSVKCWGANGAGALGLGDTQPRGDGPNEMGDMLPKVDPGPGETATAISAGGGFTCALLSGGRAKCWGNNFSGELGLGDDSNRGDNPNEMGFYLLPVDL